MAVGLSLVSPSPSPSLALFRSNFITPLCSCGGHYGISASLFFLIVVGTNLQHAGASQVGAARYISQRGTGVVGQSGTRGQSREGEECNTNI